MFKSLSRVLFSGILLSSWLAFAEDIKCQASLFLTADLTAWTEAEERIAFSRILDNIDHEETMEGAVLASPSKNDPNYFFHWVRDAALVMKSFLSSDQATRWYSQFKLEKLIGRYFLFEGHLQDLPAPTGLGEPKFRADGSVFEEDWGRPQNDGPALRSLFFIKWANRLLDKGKEKWVRENLFSTMANQKTLIERDLWFVVQNWVHAGFDLWEEKNGHHFFTRYAQRRALLEGAKLARRLGDEDAFQRLVKEANSIADSLHHHLSHKDKYIISNLPVHYFPLNPHALGHGVDVSVVLTLNQNYDPDDSLFKMKNSWVLSTVHKIEESFRAEYPINRREDIPGLGIGRYPGDVFDGAKNEYGNPWFLATLGMAEYYYYLVQELQIDNRIIADDVNIDFLKKILNRDTIYIGDTVYFDKEELRLLTLKADSYVARVKFHVDEDGSMSEQFDRYTGYQRSARHLSWSYAAFLSAIKQRRALPAVLFERH
ncbi:MAG: glycoside hydrolase family 15 protein [Proteobacteria bacterium]|nr:glycoside hydrolase family 15 protein [Pseudomonadota bacterium]